MLPREFLVVIGDNADTELLDAISLLGSYGDSSLHDFAYMASDDLNGQWEDPRALLWSSSSSSPVGLPVALFGWLAENRPELHRIRLATMSTKMLDEDAHIRLAKGVSKLERAVSQYAVQVECHRYVVALPSANDGPPTAQLMRSGVRANLVVIPRDSSSFEAVAKPVSRAERTEFVAHIATEVATLFSLWREMTDEPAIDRLPRIPPGDNETIVYFVTSRVGVLNCPPLPIAQLISGDGELPCPHEYYTLPDAIQRSGIIASALYPSHLVFETSERPDLTKRVSLRSFWRRYVTELIGIVTGLPRLVRKGIQAEIEGIAVDALQEALGGSKSVVRIIGADPSGDITPVSQAYVDEVISEVAALTTEPLLAAIGSETWSQLVEQFLGVADGGKVAEETRRQIADERYLAVLQDAMGPDIVASETAMEDIYAGLPVDEAADDVGPPTLPEPPIDAPTVDGFGLNPENPQTQFNHEKETAAVGANLNGESEVAKPVVGELETFTVPDLMVSSEYVRSRESVLSRVGGLLEENANSASARVAQMIDVLREMPRRFEAKQSGGYSKAAKLALALGLSVIYLVTGALTGRRYFFSGEALGSSGQDYIWLLSSTILILMALLGLTFRNSGNSQARAITFGTFALVTLAVEYVFFAPMRDFVLSLSIIQESAIVGIAILVLTVALVGVSYTRNRLSELILRRRYSSILLGAVWIYVLIGVTAYLGTDRSPLRELSPAASLRLMFVSYVLGVALVLSAGFVTAFVMMRERYRMDRAQAELFWAVEELRVSAEASRRLNLARGQWLGTALPLARLIRYPLGESIAHSAGAAFPERPRLMVLKVDEDVLKLKKAGEQSLSARLRSLFIRTGWLARQYQQLITRYRIDRASSLGLRPDAVSGDRPERCPATPSISEIRAGKARGARWDFMRSVMAGEYDDSLLSIAGEVPLEEAYATIIDDPELHSVGESESIAPKFFARLLPTKPIPLPGGLVKTLFAGNDDRRYLSATVWWPDELVARPAVQPGVNLHKSDVLTPDRLTSWIRLFGACVLTSKPFRLSDVTLSSISEEVSETGFEEGDSQSRDTASNY